MGYNYDNPGDDVWCKNPLFSRKGGTNIKRKSVSNKCPLNKHKNVIKAIIKAKIKDLGKTYKKKLEACKITKESYNG